MNESYWASATLTGNAGADAWEAVCELVRRTYGLTAYSSLVWGKNPQMNGLRQQRAHVTRGPMDTLLARVSTLLRRQAETTGHIEQLEQDRKAVTELVASRVQQALEAAGGKSDVTAAVHSALALRDAMPVRPAELDQVEEDLRRLEMGGADAAAIHGVLKARQEELTAELAAQADLGRQSRKTRAVALVRQAISGCEGGRQELERLATVVPRAFPPGFGEGITAARFDRAVIAELSSAPGLTRSRPSTIITSEYRHGSEQRTRQLRRHRIGPRCRAPPGRRGGPGPALDRLG